MHRIPPSAKWQAPTALSGELAQAAMEPQLSTGNDYNDLQIDLLRNIMLGIRGFRKEMKAMHKRKGKLEDHRNTQHATHARLSLRQHLWTYERERIQPAQIHINEYT